MIILTHWLHRELSNELLLSKAEYKARKTNCAMGRTHTHSIRKAKVEKEPQMFLQKI